MGGSCLKGIHLIIISFVRIRADAIRLGNKLGSLTLINLTQISENFRN